jgi:hypothetical protein
MDYTAEIQLAIFGNNFFYESLFLENSDEFKKKKSKLAT